MKLKFRRILSVLLVLAMVASFLPAIDLSVKASAADDAASKTAVFEFVYDISEYRGTKEAHVANNDAKYSLDAVYTDYPAKEGYVFAGWFESSSVATPLKQDVTSGSAYAKFVPEELMKAVAQVSTTTDYTTASSALRFVSAVESLHYLQAGFLLNKEGSSKTYTHAVGYVYDKLSAAVEGGSLTPTYFHSSASHMSALTLTNIKNQGANYTATPFWITYDGTKVDHIPTAKKAVQMGIAANMAAGRTEVEEGYDYSWYTPSATEYTISSMEQMRAFIKISNTHDFAGKTVKLATDISFNTGIAGDKMLSTGSGIPLINGAVATDPIGSTAVPFAGTFDGQGHTVSGLVSKTGYDGLFAAIKDATIKNVTVARSTLRAGSGGGCSAGLVGTTFGTSTIENVHIAKDVNLWNATYQGGVVGHNQGHLTIKNTWSGAYVNPQWGANVYVGGLVGMNANNTATSLTLENCLYDGSMSGTAQGASFIGGLIGAAGNNPTTKITDCLVTGNLTGMVTSTGTLYCGSLIGSKSWTAANTVTADVYAMTEAYTNADGAAQPIRADQSFASGVTSVTKANLTGAAAKTNAAGLDYTAAWAALGDGTPILSFADPKAAVDTSWYNDTDTVFFLKDAADLNGFVLLSKTNTFAGKTVKLSADITYNTGDASTWGTTAPKYMWTPIGNGDNGFTGVFDGNGHTVSGLYYKGGSYASFIARMYGASAKLKNVRIVNSWFESDGTADSFHNGAGIVGRATNGYTVSGVYTDAYFKGVKSMGIVAFSDAGVTNISNCWNDGTMDASALTRMGTDPGVGGMIGVVANNQTHNITNCLVTATFTGTLNDGEYLGGIFGMAAWGAKVKATDCLVAGDMSGVTGGVVGSIAGNNPGGNGSVYTDVYATNETHANLKGGGGATFPINAVAKADILGDAASTTLTGLDFASTWSVRAEDVPAVFTSDAGGWYDADKSEIIINTAEDLYAFSIAQETDSFSGKTVKLGADIVLNEGNAADWATTPPANVWEPIGKDDATLAFEGTFDGNGHTISGLYYDSALYGGGLFVYTGSNATIKNLKIVNSYIRSTHATEWSATGTFAAFVNGTAFVDLYADTIIDADSGFVGGIGGRLQGAGAEFTNCEFAGTITGSGATANYYGGILGGANTNTAGATTYTDCTFSGSVTGNRYVGGLSGRSSGAAGSSTTVTGCKITGTVAANNTNNQQATEAGGVFGLAEVSTVTITNTNVSGTVNSPLGIAGGYIGIVSSSNVTIDNGTFTGAVNGGTKLAGFVGRVNTAGYTTTIKNSVFDGTVTATSTSESTAAGFVANVNNGNVTLQNCEAKGTVDGPGAYAAGAIAQIMNVAGVTIVLDQVYSTAAVKNAASNVGGLVGRIHGTSPDVTIKNCLAAATFTSDTWATAQIIAHAQNNAVKMANNFFVQTEYSYTNGVEANGGAITHSPVKVSQEIFDHLVTLYEGGMHPDYNGFVDGGFIINDAEDLYGFNIYSQLSDCAGKTVKLGADITINTGDAADWNLNAPALNWLPIGAKNSATKYNGNFDGQGYTISGLYCAYPNGNSLGMFRETTGTITHFKLVNSYLVNTVDDGYGYNGVIAAYQNGGTISKIYTDAFFHPIDSYAGGIVGFTGGTTATITECVFDGSLLARCYLNGACDITGGQPRSHANYIGGILGAATATNTYVTNCINTGKITNECCGAHRTGGLLGGLPTAGKAATVTGCIFSGEFRTSAHTNNSYHFSLILDCRSAGGSLTNDATMFTDNYVESVQVLDARGEAVNNGSTAAGANGTSTPTVCYTESNKMTDAIENHLAEGTCPLDFASIWNYNHGALPTLKWMDDADNTLATHYLTTEEGGKLLSVSMPDATYDQFVDMTIEETPTGQTYTVTLNDEEVALDYLYLEQVNHEAVSFQDIFYGAGTYLTKYTGTTLANAQDLVAEMKTFGFTEVVSNNINGDCYYTALTFADNVYTVTHFTTTGETYVSVSNEQKLSPFMDSEYFKTAVNTEGGEPVAETPYTDVTITSVPLDNGGDAFIIRLKNGHYIVIDGGTNRQSDRDRVAEALGASQAAYDAGDKNNPQVVVDAWFFTHAHADHAGIWRGGIYGPLQVDVYIKGFYYNFTEKWHVDSQIKVGGTEEEPVYADGYLNLAYQYADQDTDGVNFYKKMHGDNSEFWTEWTATHKTAAVVNTPSWGSWGIPIYRVQAGQKFYFDGMTVEVPYTQEQVQPSEMNLDLNGTCSWFLLTDDYGHTFLDAGDAEAFNAEAVAELYSADYELFGADIGKTFHHGLNPLVKHTGTFGETPSESTAGNYDYTLVDQFYGIGSNYGDGNQTKFVFITKTAGSWAQITGYNNKGGSQRDLSIHEMYYLFGYILPTSYGGKIRDYVGWGYATVDTKIPFAAYGDTYTSGAYTDTFEGITTVTMNENGITWDKYHTNGIYD